MTARPTETLIEKHTRLALSTLGNAEREIEAGDLPQAGEKLWGASCHAIKAYCASHDLPHGKYQPPARRYGTSGPVWQSLRAGCLRGRGIMPRQFL